MVDDTCPQCGEDIVKPAYELRYRKKCTALFSVAFLRTNAKDIRTASTYPLRSTRIFRLDVSSVLASIQRHTDGDTKHRALIRKLLPCHPKV
eukprot:6196696-Pleurochrysis_carterae.AAC.4